MVVPSPGGIPITDLLIWIVMGTFLVGVLAARRDRQLARTITAGAWALFGLFWLTYVPYFIYVHRSIVEAFLAVIGVPVCLFVGYHLWRGRDSLLLLSKAVAVMGLIYLPFETIPILHDTFIEIVARQTELGIRWLGYSPEIEHNEAGLRNVILFRHESGATYGSVIVLACTGIGSMAIFGGLIAAVDEPIRRRLGALVFVVSTIWVLNFVRNVFIALSHGLQLWDHPWLIEPVMFLFGLRNPARVSFFFSDRIVSQLLAVVALVAIFWVVLKLLPGLTVIVEDLLYLLTGEEYDLDLGGPGGGSEVAVQPGGD